MAHHDEPIGAAIEDAAAAILFSRWKDYETIGNRPAFGKADATPRPLALRRRQLTFEEWGGAWRTRALPGRELWVWGLTGEVARVLRQVTKESPIFGAVELAIREASPNSWADNPGAQDAEAIAPWNPDDRGSMLDPMWAREARGKALDEDGRPFIQCRRWVIAITYRSEQAIFPFAYHDRSDDELSLFERLEDELGSEQPKRHMHAAARFTRDHRIIEMAKQRARYQCEVPGCTYPTFRGTDGSLYLEVHHIVPLSNGGRDRLSNVACICPLHHLEVHHGDPRVQAAISTALTDLRRRGP